MLALRPTLATLLVSSLLALAPVADALCAAPVLVATLITPLDAPVPAAGGLLVRVDYRFSGPGVRATLGADERVRLPELALVRASTRVAIRQEPLPGGLVRLAFERPPAPGVYTLEGFGPPEAPSQQLTIGGTLPAPPEVPLVRQVVHQARVRTSTGPRGGSSVTEWNTRLVLARPLGGSPALLVLRRPGSEGSAQVVDADATSTTLEAQGSQGGRCGAGFEPGRGLVAVRAEVEALVIDRFARVSPPSAPVRVR